MEPKRTRYVVLFQVVALSFGLFTSQAAAESAESTIDVYAGLASTLILTCNDVNFGVWRVPTGIRTNGATTITLTGNADTLASDASVTAGANASIALSGDWAAPAAGFCTVSGASVADGFNGTVSISDPGAGSFGKNGNSGYGGEVLAEPTTAASLSYALRSTTPTDMADGVSSFIVHGTMIIPDNLAADNYGGYQAAPVTISFAETSRNWT